MKGNPNPSPETRFKPGDVNNPVGKTSAQRRMEIENAERATRIRGRMLADLERELDRLEAEALETGASQTTAIASIKADILKLLKDTEDRGLGTPKQSITHGSDPDNPMPTVIRIEAASVDSDGPAST